MILWNILLMWHPPDPGLRTMSGAAFAVGGRLALFFLRKGEYGKENKPIQHCYNRIAIIFCIFAIVLWGWISVAYSVIHMVLLCSIMKWGGGGGGVGGPISIRLPITLQCDLGIICKQIRCHWLISLSAFDQTLHRCSEPCKDSSWKIIFMTLLTLFFIQFW